VGGNFLETLPEPDRVREALARVPLRVHQDVVVSPTILADGADVLLLPATTRYEQPGGGTETTTERRIVLSPEIPGRRIGEARSEWQVLQELGRRAVPEHAHALDFADAAAVRAEIARAVPAYAGVEGLRAKGDQVQWGGERLCEGGRFGTPDGRARFHPVPIDVDAPAPGRFRLSTRRGRQFNSMLYAERDPLTGAGRDAVLISARDCRDLGLSQGDRIRLRSEVGSFEGRVQIAAIRPRNLQVHWPEGNVLLPAGRVDPRSGEPDFNTWVEILPSGAGSSA
jgi:predicted molibdopterin-dependent oxidoreductase YjgC